VDGAQGALIRPEWIRGREHTSVSPPGCAGDPHVGITAERLIRKSRSREAETR